MKTILVSITHYYNWPGQLSEVIIPSTALPYREHKYINNPYDSDSARLVNRNDDWNADQQYYAIIQSSPLS